MPCAGSQRTGKPRLLGADVADASAFAHVVASFGPQRLLSFMICAAGMPVDSMLDGTAVWSEFLTVGLSA